MSKAWRDWLPPDDGGAVDLKPGDPGYDPVLAADGVPLMDRPAKSTFIPHAGGMFFGPQLGWSPGREDHPEITLFDRTTGEVIAAGVCPECLDGLTDAVRVDGYLCASCLKSRHDVRIAVELEADRLKAEAGVNSDNVGVEGGKIRFRPTGVEGV